MEYGIYIAEILGSPTTDDCRCCVRILPQMSHTETKYCPCWSYFFKDKVFVGRNGEFVWVICDNEFSNGYILGPVNNSCLRTDDFSSSSVSSTFWKKISDVMVSLSTQSFNFSDLDVTFWNGKCIHFTERSTGGKVIAYDNGTLYIFRGDSFLVKIGENILRINSDSISMSTGSADSDRSIALQSGNVRLGMNPSKNILATMGVKSDVAETNNDVWV